MAGTEKKDGNRFVIAVYADNKYGVLTRVTSMFTRRGFNIDNLTVGVTERPEYSRITLTMSGDGYARDQMINQLRKLYNVKKVEFLDDVDAVQRELILIKIKNDPENHQRVLSALEIFKAKILDYSVECLCIEATGAPAKIDALIEMLKPLGILELCRTGTVAIKRGPETIMGDID